ncbi:MAG: RluA family pseudouridine synthase [Bacteroidales bacterium]|nr:RluA family pseudouridine synthase [Bacteroidales bacterium]
MITDEILTTSESDDNSELFERYRFTIDAGQEMVRMDKWLSNRIGNSVSRTKIQQAADLGMIFVNGIAKSSNYKVKPNDEIVIVLPTPPPPEVELIPQNIPINIVFEDNDVIIVNKPAGLVVHPGFGNTSGTLLNALLWHFQETKQTDAKPFLVHRIDKDTSGLLVIAKNEESQLFLAKQFFDHSTERKYTALVWGDFSEDSGTIVGNIGRDLKDRRKMHVFPDGSQGRSAVTHYTVLERFGYVSLVECRLETGRTHQIRAHFQYIKHPLFGDLTYGGDQIVKGTTFTKYKQFVKNCFQILPRQALHASIIGFIHPTTRQKVVFDSALPEDLTQVIYRWKNYANNYEN